MRDTEFLKGTDNFLNKVDKTIATNKTVSEKESNTIRDNTIKESNINNTLNLTALYEKSFNNTWGPYIGTCPHCGSNNIEANYGMVLTSMPPQYNCRCKDCNGTFVSGQIKQENKHIIPDIVPPFNPPYTPTQPENPNYDYGWGNMRQGWICPRCGKVNSPDRNFCDCSSNGGWGSPIIWCNSGGTSAGKPNTMHSNSVSTTQNSNIK